MKRTLKIITLLLLAFGLTFHSQVAFSADNDTVVEAGGYWVSNGVMSPSLPTSPKSGINHPFAHGFISSNWTYAYCAYDPTPSAAGTGAQNVYQNISIIEGQWQNPKRPEQSFSAAQVSELAYLVNKFGASVNPVQASAVDYALGLFAGNPNEYGKALPINNSAEVASFANSYLAEAKDFAGPYTVSGELLEDGDNTLKLANVALVSASGKQVPDLDFRIELSGPATFAGGNTIIDSKSQSGAQSFDLVLQNTGAVQAKITYDGVTDNHLYWAESNTYQSMFIAGKPTIASGEVSQDFTYVVTPNLSTKVTAKTAVTGGQLSDQVTLQLPLGHSWPQLSDGSAMKVTVNGKLYGPFTEKQPRSQEVPADAPLAFETELVFDSPQKLTSASFSPTTGGYYTWVWQSEKVEAPGVLKLNSTQDDFFSPLETVLVKNRIKHSSQVQESTVTLGAGLIDEITISGIHETSLNQNAVAKITVYGPLSERPQQAQVPDNAPVFTQLFLPAKNGTFTVGTDYEIKPQTAGFYVFVYQFSGDKNTHGYTSRFNDVNEIVEVTVPAPVKSIPQTPVSDVPAPDNQVPDAPVPSAPTDVANQAPTTLVQPSQVVPTPQPVVTQKLAATGSDPMRVLAIGLLSTGGGIVLLYLTHLIRSRKTYKQ